MKDEQLLDVFMERIDVFQMKTKEANRLDLLSLFGNTHHELSHSNTLYRLLVPDAFPESQSYGDSFLAMVGKAVGTSVDGEHIIGIEREKLTSNHRFIDINMVTENCEIIIENKIDFRDRVGQLTDYLRYAENAYPDKTVLVIYLTLSGYEPSEASISRDKVEELKREHRFGVLSYEKDIIDWLDSLPAEGILKSEIDVYKETLKEICGMYNKNEAIIFGKQNFNWLKKFFISDPVKSSICKEGLDYIRTTATNLEFLRLLRDRLQEETGCRTRYFLAQSEVFMDYNAFEEAVLSSNAPYGIGLDLDDNHRIGLEFNPRPNLIDGWWYFGYMKGVKGTGAELNPCEELRLTPDWKDKGFRVYAPSELWGEYADATTLIRDNVGTKEYGDCVSMVFDWFKNQIEYHNQQKEANPV